MTIPGVVKNCWWGYKLIQPLWKKFDFIKLEHTYTLGPSNTSARYILNKNAYVLTKTCVKMYIAVILVIAQIGAHRGVTSRVLRFSLHLGGGNVFTLVFGDNELCT